MQDLSSLVPSTAAATMEVLHPGTGDVLPGVTITLIGQDSPEYQKAERALVQRRLRQSKGFRQKAIPDAEEIVEANFQMAVTCTKGWTGIDWKGEDLAFSDTNARMLYKELPWLVEQILAFIQDRANYLGKSSKTS